MNRTYAWIMMVGLSVFSLIFFQNCENKVDFGLADEALLKSNSFNGFVINNGDIYTNKLDVTLNLESKSAKRVAVYDNDNCSGTPEYRDYDPNMNWTLADDNNLVRVSIRFEVLKGTQSGTRLTECLSDGIIHDGLAPVLKIQSGPIQFSNESDSRIEMSVNENGSGISKFECFLNDSLVENCSDLMEVSDLAEQQHAFKVRVEDQAGNISEWTTWNWMVDQTPPNVEISEGPDRLVNTAAAKIIFSGSDDSSGIESFKCKWSDESEYKPCKEQISRGDLKEGAQFVSIISVDKAGNESEAKEFSWEVDTLPPGQFDILGVSGDSDSTDQKADQWFSGDTTIKVNWSTAKDGVSYKGHILSANSESLCDFATSAGVVEAEIENCNLESDQLYKVKIEAIDRIDNKSVQTYDFTVDRDGPSISFKEPSIDNENMYATVHFNVSDQFGVDSVACEISGANNFQRDLDCQAGMDIRIEDLAKGVYSFSVMASDKAGNSTSRSQNLEVVPIVCNPFSLSEEKCEKGLKGNIYYLTQDQTSLYRRVDDYIKYGTKVEATIYLNQLAIPTLSWTLGFETDRGITLRGNEGQKLFEYFALDLQSILKLNDTDEEGLYQFAILSDDGSLVEITNSDGEKETLINNDGNHPTRMGCADKVLDLKQDSRVPIRVKYYQGPRNHISLTLMWRKVDSSVGAVRDPLCGVQGNSKYFGSKDSYKSPDYENYSYADLVNRGWKTISPSNFILDEESENTGTGASN